MKILQVNTSDQGGGAEGSAWNLFQEYRGRGHDSWLAVGNKKSDDPDVLEIPRFIQRRSIEYFFAIITGRLNASSNEIQASRSYYLSCLSTTLLKVFGRYLGVEDFNYPGTRELLELPPEQPDIVHIHNAHGGYLDLRWVSSISNSKPAILNLRDMWLLTGHCAYPLGCKRWKVGCGNCPDLSIYPSISRDATSFNWKRKLGIYKNSKLFITTPSEWLMNNVKESMLEGIEYRVIPNAIDLGIFRPGDKSEARDELTLPKDSKIILFAAHSQFKDYATVVESLNLANSNKRLLFICLGKNGEDEKLANGNLIHVGFKSDPKEVANYFRAADIFVHASKGEAFGKTIVEAMGCGVPVIATKIGGIPEIITHGVTGFLIGPRNSYQLAKKIELLLSNDVLRTSIGQAGLKHTLQNYGLQRQASSFLDWYKEILQRF